MEGGGGDSAETKKEAESARETKINGLYFSPFLGKATESPAVVCFLPISKTHLKN